MTASDASPDPILAPGPFGLAPTEWGRLVQRLFEAQTVEAAQVEEMIRELRSVPALLRHPGPWAQYLYPNARGADPRLRLVGWLDAGAPFDAKKLARALTDANALHIEGLELEKASQLNTLLTRLDESPITRLRALELGFAPSEEALDAIDAHPKLQALERFVVKGTMKARFAKLASLSFVRRLRALNLPYTADKASMAHLEALAAVPFERLETFVLTGKSSRPKGSRAFLDAPWLHRLRYLQLEGLESDGVDALAASAVLPQLEALGIRGARGTEAALVKLLSSLRSCTNLHLDFVQLEDRGATLPAAIAQAIADSGCAPRLEELLASLDDEGKSILERAGLDATRARADESATRGFWYRLH